MRIKLTTAADILAMIWALGRNVGDWNSGMLTNTRYIITAIIKIITKVICKTKREQSIITVYLGVLGDYICKFQRKFKNTEFTQSCKHCAEIN